MERVSNIRNYFNEGLKELGLELNPSAIERTVNYFEMLLETNSCLNLISSKQDLQTQVAVHLVDSLGLLLWPDLPDEVMALDFGSGGGLPAIPLALAKPLWDYTLSEATGKKTSFLIDVKNKLEIENIIIKNHYLTSREYKDVELFNIVTARGVAALDKLVSIAVPRLKSKGLFIAYKGPQADKEVFEAKKNLKKYRTNLINQIEFNLPVTGAKRKILIFQVD